jgi:hypothetical protein
VAVDLKAALRSPREMLGGYVILPRLIDKVRLNARGLLPHEYVKNLLGSSAMTLDGRLLEFTGLAAEELKKAILSSDSDKAVLSWVESHARPHSMAERREWARQIESYRADPARLAYRKQTYPDLASRVDLGTVNVFDLIDMDEGRIPVPDQGGRTR